MRRRRTVVAIAFALVVAVVAVVRVLTAGLTEHGGPTAPQVPPVPPVAGTPDARIAVAGDTGTGDRAVRATVDAMVAQASHQGPYDALVLLGDLIYNDGDAAKVDERITDPFAPVLETGAELVPALGNHDVESGEQGEILTELGRSRSWYVDEVGPVRVVVLDSNRVDDVRQTRWLETTLADHVPSGTWTIVALHHPPFSAGDHGSDLEVRRAWVPLFEEFDVALVLAGHDHDYQRSRPIDGVTYVVSGAGAKLRPTGRAEFTEVSTSTLHFLDLAVHDDRLVGRAVDQAGVVLDEFTVLGP
jgi:3',5'-cyclic AMP phosphodiesterase CpdA